ncbi:uncharacterized protein [Triticum aestivum]|uniref:uncharacterized protein n=1 Tax=Triticum aestivum TaxID=4565 RepID=UPI00084419E7|nr:uncharacterized protein LOC123184269 [Triticum aestivum]
MAWCTKNIGKGLLAATKVLICLCLVTMLVLSSEEMKSDACDKDWSLTWDNSSCILRGTCNKPCRRENFERGICKKLFHCMCYRHCNTESI